MPDIAWAQFSWEAFATLATGAMAVAGAVWIGLRQMTISAKQTAILEQQAHQAELALRWQLFDRRMEVYSAIGKYLMELLTHAKPPRAEVEREFYSAIGKARFMFSEPVNLRLAELRTKALQFSHLSGQMELLFEAEGHYGPGNPDTEAVLLEWFMDRFQHLPDTFGEEIRLA